MATKVTADWQWLWGRHPVEEALRAGGRSLKELWILHQSRDPRIRELVGLARTSGARVCWVHKKELDRVSGGEPHQGLALQVGGRSAGDLFGLLPSLSEGERKTLVLVALDQIQDPQNLGAVVRSAACLGASGVILPERRAAPVGQAASRASAGAIERIPVYTVGNLAQALERLKSGGFWIYGADRSGTSAWQVAFNAPMVLVVGSEGAGMRPVVLERCDEVVSIPQSSRGVDSLNASCAASVLLYEAARQMRGSK